MGLGKGRGQEEEGKKTGGRGLLGFLWERPGSVEGFRLPTSQEYGLITYVTVWCEPLAGGSPAWRRVTRLTMASR